MQDLGAQVDGDAVATDDEHARRDGGPRFATRVVPTLGSEQR